MLQLGDEPPGALTGTAAGSEAAHRLELVDEVTLSGEIVDSKCYLGVMKPGRDKPHRACASLCIRGGVPPILVVEDARGDRDHYFLIDADGEPIGGELLDLVAEPVRVSGRVYRLGDLRFLAAPRAAFERLP
jgi:hypothetical protein